MRFIFCNKLVYNDIPTDTGWAGDGGLNYRKIGKTVFLYGWLAVADNNKSIGTLPAGYRPKIAHSICAYCVSNNYGTLTIYANGTTLVNTSINIGYFTSYTVD